MRHCWLAVVLGVVAVLVTGVAQAGPPYVTDDPETPEEGCWEVNTPYGFERSNGLEQVQEPLLDINYGYRSNLQLKLELPLLHVSGPGQPSTTGVGDTWVGAKWRFAEQTANRPAIAVYPQLSLPTGDAGRGLGAGKSSYVLPLEAERTLGPWTAIANVGRVWQTADHTEDYWFYGVNVCRVVGTRWELGGEVFGNGPTAPGEADFLAYNIGLQRAVRPDLSFLFSAGHSLQGTDTALLYAGLQFEFGTAPEHHQGGQPEPRERHPQAAPEPQ